MTSILFICHGNICRSPMAEFIFKDMAEKAGLGELFEVQSAATSREETGNDMYPPAKAILREHGIPYSFRQAHQVTAWAMDHHDYIIIMDSNNARNLQRMFGDRYDDKIYKLMSFAGENRDVSDPWYTDNFEQAYDDIERGCRGLFERLIKDAE